MKKLLSWLLLTCLLLSGLSACQVPEGPQQTERPQQTEGPQPTQTVNNEVGKEGALLTFCAMSDLHLADVQTEETFERAMKYFTNLQIKPEAYLFVGDLTNTTAVHKTTSQIQILKDIYEKYEEPKKFFYCLGPGHDAPYNESWVESRTFFRNAFGEAYFVGDTQDETVMIEYGFRHRVVNGFHFISVDADDDNDGLFTDEQTEWLVNTLNEATAEDPEKPIFLIQHKPDGSALNRILRQYPQVVRFSGHEHNSLAREDSITQDGRYTRVHCGGLFYYRVNAYKRTSSDPYEFEGNKFDFGHALYVQVDKDYNVTFTRLDVWNGTPIEEEWVVGPDRRNVYMLKRSKEGEGCRFQAESKLQVTEKDGKITAAWDAAYIQGAGGVPLYYRVTLLGSDGQGGYQVIEQKDLSSQEVFFPNGKGIPSLHYKWTFTPESALEDYAITVSAADCWNESENDLVFTNGSYQHDKETTGQTIHVTE